MLAVGLVAAGIGGGAVAGDAGAGAAPSAHASTVTLSYGSDPLQTVTVYPASTPGSPLIVFVHGGGFQSTASLANQIGPLASTLSHAGFAVFNVNYRTDAPKVPAFPNEVDDIETGTRLAIADASKYDGNPTNVTLVGGSAGGSLVALAGEALGPTVVKNVVGLSGVYDFPMELSYWTQVGTKDAYTHLVHETVALGCPHRTAASCSSAVAKQWSADQQVTVHNCPSQWLLVNGANETNGTPVAQPDAMTKSLNTAGCHVTETIVSGTDATKASWDLWDDVSAAVEAMAQGGGSG
ncbi:MAG: alpha/beta hydrolase [Acidimicrobiales bacterium]|nr:alpha/beta hydrolase [Acidimicrobiales bacterium]